MRIHRERDSEFPGMTWTGTVEAAEQRRRGNRGNPGKTNGKQGPWSQFAGGTVGPWNSSLGRPRSRGRRTVEQVRRGNWAGAEDWSTQGERLRESTGREKKK